MLYSKFAILRAVILFCEAEVHVVIFTIRTQWYSPKNKDIRNRMVTSLYMFILIMYIKNINLLLVGHYT